MLFNHFYEYNFRFRIPLGARQHNRLFCVIATTCGFQIHLSKSIFYRVVFLYNILATFFLFIVANKNLLKL